MFEPLLNLVELYDQGSENGALMFVLLLKLVFNTLQFQQARNQLSQNPVKSLKTTQKVKDKRTSLI